ncbi:carcinine transporter isoform X1 [Neodiprion pinetum]|uniref:carcinine transporter isoform X1 n=1 Tax=Neodiprion pinetum TaxID=441929 RepID=UPI001EDD6AB1|nr:carcinine transporter isoform X1 [Neodiprion pinetum]
MNVQDNSGPDDRQVHRVDDDDDGFDLDDLLPIVGEFGRYQRLLLWFVCLPACLPCGFCAFNQLFMSETPPHWCKVPGLEGLDPPQRRHLGIPSQGDNESYSRCTRYNIDWETPAMLMAEYLTPNASWSVIPCDHGWEYDESEVTSSIVIDFNLVCNYSIYPTFGLVALNTGGPIGVYLFGMLNDRIGRRLSFFICLATLITGGFLTSVANSFWTWAGTRFIVGLTIPAIYQIPFIISLELVGPNYRSFVTVMTCTFYTIGLCTLAGVTYLVRDWRLLALTTSAPFLLYFLYWWFLPESPRWLLAKGRLEEANEILETLARVNGKELPDSFTQKLRQRMTMSRSKSEEERLRSGPGILALFKTPNMRLKTCLITLNWFANNMVYVGLSYYGPALGSEEHLSFFFSSLAEIPSYMACWVVMDRWGRRWPLCLCMVVAGASCIATVILPEDAVTATLILFLLSKSAISASFLIIYPFAGELYPTQLRGAAIGFSAYVSGLGLIIIPFITYLGTENLVLPLIILGMVSMIGGLSGLRLPETLHYRLPQTVEEGELFGKNWSWADCIRCIPKRPSSTTTSYEDLSAGETVEMQQTPDPFHATEKTASEESPLNTGKDCRDSHASMRRLVRQSSVMDTQRDSDGAIKLAYWF